MITVHGIQRRLPPIKIDSYDYFILSGTYQKFHNEKLITERYAPNGTISRQLQDTEHHRWKFTLEVPLDAAQVTVRHGSLTVGDLDTLYASAEKQPPDDMLEYQDITELGTFGVLATHFVYLSLGDGVPDNNDPGRWQIPIELYGYSPPFDAPSNLVAVVGDWYQP